VQFEIEKNFCAFAVTARTISGPPRYKLQSDFENEICSRSCSTSRHCLAFSRDVERNDYFIGSPLSLRPFDMTLKCKPMQVLAPAKIISP